MDLKDLKKEQVIEAILIFKDELSKGQKKAKELKKELKEEKANNKVLEMDLLQLECILNSSFENNEEYFEEHIQDIFSYAEHVKSHW